jgi:Ca-activated chloride channel family protein
MVRSHTTRFLAAALLASPCLWAADPKLPRFAVESNLVVLSATAVDKKGRPITNLRPQEFRIFEDGRAQPLRHFSAGATLPARLLLLVDASGSMDAQLKEASVRMALIQLMAALGPADEVALAGFDERYFGVVPFTRDRRLIQQGFTELRPWGTTALHDALDKAASDLSSHGEGRRAIVVLTDGIDTASKKAPAEVIERSRTLDVPIYTVSVISRLDDPRSRSYVGARKKGQTQPEAARGAELLAQYAALSGGASFVVSDFRNLKAAADRIALELKHQYRLSYDRPPGPLQFRHVQVKATRKGVAVKTRSGYLPQS